MYNNNYCSLASHLVSMEVDLILTVTHGGTKSHLLSTNIRCLWGFSFFMKVSMCFERVPIGSLASRT